MRRIPRIVLLLFCIWQQSNATDYQYLQYRVEDGLKTDIIKTIDRDNLGFIWIGSDDGLMQYNGYRFVHYPYATQSPYVKDLIKLRDGRLLVLNDLGLVEINNQIDTVIFKEILPGTRVPTDTTIWYPKSVYEDSRGTLWISEPQSIVKYDGKTIKRIRFGPEHSSSSFIRSFCFVELPDGKILISSFNGSFFIYDHTTEALVALEHSGRHPEINYMIFWNNSVYLACDDGIYSAIISDQHSIVLNKQNNLINTSYLMPIDNSTLLISTYASAGYIYNLDEGIKEIPFKFTVVNQSFRSEEGNIWLSTEKGVVLLKPKIFNKVKAEAENVFVESVVLSDNGEHVYYCSKEHIRRYNTKDRKSRIFDNIKKGYYLSLQFHNNYLWASNSTNVLQYNTDGQIVSTWDFSTYGRFIFDIKFDETNTLWLTQESGKGLKSIDPKGKIKYYGEKYQIFDELTIVRTNEQGIFAGTSNPENYIYFKSYDDSLFKNISLNIPFEYPGNFRVNDIALEDDGTIWIASSVGLLKQTSQKLEKVPFEEKFENMIVKTVINQKNSNNIWFSNAYGLVQYNTKTNEYYVYDESHGLPSNTVNTRSLIVNDRSIWVGTASGLAYSKHDFQNLSKTPKPQIIELWIDGQQYKPSIIKETVFPVHPNLGIIVSSPTYPVSNLKYQYKINTESTEWNDLLNGNMLVFSKLKSGNYELSFRAKKAGNYSWSETNTYHFTVQKAFYETWYFFTAILLFIVILIITTRHISTKLLKERELELTKQVEERTAELAQANINLLERNQELDQFVYSTSHDLSAPLKSIRGLINIANYEDDPSAQKSLLDRMNQSVIKLETFIRDVISYSRNARLEIKKKSFNLKEMVMEILDHISNLDHFHQIKFDIDIDENVNIISDETRVKIVLNNLISNAVKFQRFGEESEPLVSIKYWHENNRHFIKVKDNGLGIPQEFQEKIFNMFYRANVTSDGSGLGLYILKETIKKLVGDVELSSQEGKGSEFIVSFP